MAKAEAIEVGVVFELVAGDCHIKGSLKSNEIYKGEDRELACHKGAKFKANALKGR
jgi:hypothetical protein